MTQPSMEAPLILKRIDSTRVECLLIVSNWSYGAGIKKKKKERKKVKVAQFCPTLCNPMDYTVYRILQASVLEWVSFFSSPGALPNSRIKPRSPRSPALQVDSLPAEPQGKPGIKNHYTISQKCYMDWWKFCSLITFLLSCVLQLLN